MFKWIKKNTDKLDPNKAQQQRDSKITSNQIRVRVKRLNNNTPVEVAVFQTSIYRDENQNLMIEDKGIHFKDELSYIRNALVSDILFKVKHRLDSKKEQIAKLKTAIKTQEDLLGSIKDGKIDLNKKIKANEDDILKENINLDEDKKEMKVNVISEKTKLNVLKVSLYTLENEGEGSFEHVEQDGVRCVQYLLQDGELTPLYYKSPKLENEPLTLYPDIAQKKKYYKEASKMIDDDFVNSTSSPFKGFLIIILWAFFIISILGSVFLYAENLSRAKELDQLSSDNSINRIMQDVESVNKQCAVIMGQIIEEQQPLVDYAKAELNKTLQETKQKEVKI